VPALAACSCGLKPRGADGAAAVAPWLPLAAMLALGGCRWWRRLAPMDHHRLHASVTGRVVKIRRHGDKYMGSEHAAIHRCVCVCQWHMQGCAASAGCLGGSSPAVAELPAPGARNSQAGQQLLTGPVAAAAPPHVMLHHHARHSRMDIMTGGPALGAAAVDAMCLILVAVAVLLPCVFDCCHACNQLAVRACRERPHRHGV
jgi:hypothetical protein